MEVNTAQPKLWNTIYTIIILITTMIINTHTHYMIIIMCMTCIITMIIYRTGIRMATPMVCISKFKIPIFFPTFFGSLFWWHFFFIQSIILCRSNHLSHHITFFRILHLSTLRRMARQIWSFESDEKNEKCSEFPSHEALCHDCIIFCSFHPNSPPLYFLIFNFPLSVVWLSCMLLQDGNHHMPQDGLALSTKHGQPIIHQVIFEYIVQKSSQIRYLSEICLIGLNSSDYSYTLGWNKGWSKPYYTSGYSAWPSSYSAWPSSYSGWNNGG